MHPSQQELLDSRDGDGTAETELHVQSCARCTREIRELRLAAEALRSLPPLSPEEDIWSRIEDTVLGRRRRRTRWMIATVAATLVVAVTVLITVRFGHRDESAVRINPADAGLAVEQLQVASLELERVLRSPSLRSPVLSPRRAALIVDLEDRIALVDLALATPERGSAGAHTVALWSDRVELLDALVVARGGTRQDTGYQYASFNEERSYR